MSRPPQTNGIAELLSRVMEALDAGRPFAAETLALRGIRLARRRGEFERVSELAGPLGEARRVQRERAAASGRVIVVRASDPPGALRESGCYLFEPPSIGTDARALRDTLRARETAAVVVAREPLTSRGQWPVVAVGERSIRARIAPPVRAPFPDGPTMDPPPVEWFLGALSALSASALERLDGADPPAWRVDDVLDLLVMHPDSDELHTALIEASLEAAAAPGTPGERRRPIIDDPFCF